MRKEPVGVVAVLESVEPGQLALRVPAQVAFVAVPVVDVDFDVARLGAAGRDEDAAGGATYVGGGGAGGAVFEADIEEAVGG